jgi:hypothetical protein
MGTQHAGCQRDQALSRPIPLDQHSADPLGDFGCVGVSYPETDGTGTRSQPLVQHCEEAGFNLVAPPDPLDGNHATLDIQ